MSSSSSFNRRKWLGAASAGLLALQLPGCGGGDTTPDDGGAAGGGGSGGGAGGGSGGGAGGGGAAAEARLTALQGALDAATALAAGRGSFESAALAAELARSGRFKDTGVDTATQSVWANLLDGRRLIVPNNWQPARSTSAAAAQTRTADRAISQPPAPVSGRKQRLASSADLPRLLVARQFRLLDMLGPIPLWDIDHVTRNWVDQDTLPDIRKLAKGRGFEVVDLGPDDGFEFARETTVQGLKSVSSDGVFFVNTFGGAIPVGGVPETAMASSTAAYRRTSSGEFITDSAYEDDLSAGRLVYMQVPVLSAPPGSYRMVLGITPDFARFYDWQFAFNSIGFFNVTGGGTLGDWQGMLGARGLSTLMAWSEAANLRRMLAAAEDFFHLTLATNRLDGRARGGLDTRPRLRNYGNGETLGFLRDRGVISEAEFAYFPQRIPADYVNVLIPTIDYVLVDEANLECEIVGQFGAHDAGSVKTGASFNTFSEELLSDAADPTLNFGNDASITSWDGDLVRCRLSNDIRGTLIQVFNGRRWSNAARLSYWTVPITVRVAITGGLSYDITLELHMRQDVRGFRLHPAQEVAEQIPTVSIIRMKRTRAQWTAAGSISQTVSDTTTDLEWSGSSSVDAEGPGGHVGFVGRLDLRSRRFEVQFEISAEGWRERTRVTREGRVVSDVTVERTLNVNFPLAAAAPLPLVMHFSDDWSLQAGGATARQPVSILGSRTMEVTVVWPAAAVEHGPQDDKGGV